MVCYKKNSYNLPYQVRIISYTYTVILSYTLTARRKFVDFGLWSAAMAYGRIL